MADPSQRSGEDTLRLEFGSNVGPGLLGHKAVGWKSPGFNLHAWWAGSNTRDGGLALNKGI